MGIEQAELGERLAALGNLLPDLVAKLHALRAPLVLELLQVTQPVLGGPASRRAREQLAAIA